ncbi:uncharacterized protein B0P05DRAFT_519841 [Gilbertella persicaria]|uniref:uncharacterized protein n=1 Tax=Gilbertella persicaria TaxID=101096 RepID=UPI00221FC72D|nr:uncharacterized protein B0P05DRAFT_519841 [Gilbertella persicaria]KAI8047572.1 hypothetical protein B0P05DRAFT_519841 [Gilbertella persicaria]
MKVIVLVLGAIVSGTLLLAEESISTTAQPTQSVNASGTTPKINTTVPVYEWIYGYNAGHPNPDYCKGFKIESPVLDHLAFEAISIQQIKWSVNQSQLVPGKEPNSIYRIRVLSFANSNEQVIAENIAIYLKGNSGSVLFPLQVEDYSGYYKYRVMVNYGNETIHCIYESVPFRIIQQPEKTFDLTPYYVPYQGAVFSQDPQAGMTFHASQTVE